MFGKNHKPFNKMKKLCIVIDEMRYGYNHMLQDAILEGISKELRDIMYDEWANIYIDESEIYNYEAGNVKIKFSDRYCEIIEDGKIVYICSDLLNFIPIKTNEQYIGNFWNDESSRGMILDRHIKPLNKLRKRLKTKLIII